MTVHRTGADENDVAPKEMLRSQVGANRSGIRNHDMPFAPKTMIHHNGTLERFRSASEITSDESPFPGVVNTQRFYPSRNGLGLTRARQHPLEFTLDDALAFTSTRLEPGAIEHLDAATAVMDQACIM